MMMRSLFLNGLTVLLGYFAVAVFAEPPPRPQTLSGPSHSLQPIPLRQIQIRDSFWAPKLAIYKTNTIPHSWQYMGHELRSLRKVAGESVEGELNGTWGEANLHKFLETIALSLNYFPDLELEKRMDEVISLLKRAQQPDGYSHAYVVHAGKEPWDPNFLDGSHDGYVLGHLIEAALAYQAATGKSSFLEIARKAADQAYHHFLGPDGRPGFCGHAELELALVQLYRVTGEKRYLELAKAFIEWRGRGKVKPFSETPRAYFQDHVPLREQATLEGHAVRAVFFATGVAEVAFETGDSDYRLAANRFWDSLSRRRMAVTGHLGPRKEHEALGEDYELPNHGYYESCAACGLADFAQRMFLLERRAQQADVLERVLYNAVLHGISLDGTNSYYMNPLSDRNNARYNSWVCCPPNLSRTLFKIGRYAYAYGDDEVFVNLFIGGQSQVPLAKGTVRFDIMTDYPWDGLVNISVNTGQPQFFALNLRWPGWCRNLSLKLNGREIKPPPRTDQGYLRLAREWRAGDQLELSMDMPVERWEAHPAIQDGRGKVVCQRGPIIYGFEGLDNQNDPEIKLGAQPQFKIEHRPNFLGGVTVLRGLQSNGKPFLAVPYYTLANREKSWQEVWVSQEGLKENSLSWLGSSYRPIVTP